MDIANECVKRCTRSVTTTASPTVGGRVQIPPQRHRYYYVRAKVRIHEGMTVVLHGIQRLGSYDTGGRRCTGPRRRHEQFPSPPSARVTADDMLL